MLSIRRYLLAVGAGLSLSAVVARPLPAEEIVKPGDAQNPTGGKTLSEKAEKAEPEITLNVGKPAPPFVVGSWVKGEPVEALKPGQVYVVEFWATWCGPCLAGMPHISKLQTDYGDKVRIIGISREEEKVVQEFLKKDREEGVTWDQTVTYSLAMDADKQMYDTWFSAAGRVGIPSAFLVGKEGIIEWIGHPAAIDEPLAKVIEGTWDRQAAIAAYTKELEGLKAMIAARPINAAITVAVREKDWDKALKLADDLIALTPDNPSPKMTKLSLLGLSGRSDVAGALVDELVKSDWDKGALLPSIALGIVSGRYPGGLDEAERLAKRAVDVAGDRTYAAKHALAKVYAERGNYDEAIAWERKALEMSEKNVLLLRTLREYEAKKEGGAAAPDASQK